MPRIALWWIASLFFATRLVAAGPPVRRDGAILFVPGLYGSSLVDESESRQFLTLFGALFSGTPLAFNGDRLGIEGAQQLKAGPILDGVSVIPLVYAIDAYGETLAFFKKRFGDRVEITTFTYDWRDEISRSVGKLAQKVEELHQKGLKSILIVGHSLGGIITAYYLRYGGQPVETAVENWAGAERVTAAIVAAAPFKGAITAFDDLLNGTALGPAKRPLAAESLGSFYSFYEFLPSPRWGVYQDDSQRDVGTSVWQVGNWQKWKMGLFSHPALIEEPLLSKRKAYTEEGLKFGAAFTERLHAPTKTAAKKRIPLLNIRGTQYPTYRFMHWAGPTLNDPGAWALAGATTEGDGLVTLTSCEMPAAWTENLNFEDRVMPLKHRGMFTEKPLQDVIATFVEKLGY